VESTHSTRFASIRVPWVASTTGIDGAEALVVANRVRPDIGILDIGMPDLTGYEVAERIRHEAWGKDVTLIAVTGWGQDAYRRRALAAGFDHHLTKPIDPEKLECLFDA
jgi:CheY-like chemotaxis protein